MKKLLVFFIVPALSALSVFTASASAYTSYSYSSRSGAVPAPDSYTAEAVEYVNGLMNPQDMYITKDGTIYILDTGNNRIVVTDNDFSTLYEISELSGKSDKLTLNEAKGIFVNSKGDIYIADTGNRRVLKLRHDGTILAEITKPESANFSQSIEFIPNKLVTDGMGNIYVTCTGVYEGAVMFSAEGKFLGYFGAAEVTASKNVLVDAFWRQFMTDEQKESMSKYVPAELCNLDVTEDNFIFSITNSSFNVLTDEKENMDDISKLNPKGKDILNIKMSEKALEYMQKDGKLLRFADVVSDKDSFIYIVDDNLCHILQYDSDLNLLCAFGGKGNAIGLLQKPSAIESYGNKLYVLDSEKNSVTVFEETEFGSVLREAITLYNSGKYEEAIEPFTQVLKMDANYEFAYVGIGSALMGEGKYKEAMECFEKGYDSEKYNAAFKYYRIEFIRQNFLYIIVIIVVAAVLIPIFIRLCKKHIKRRRKNEP